jgi:hypothetical protein
LQGVEKELRQRREAVRPVPAVQGVGDPPGSGGGSGAAGPRRPKEGEAVITIIIIAVIGGYVLVGLARWDKDN